MFEVTLSYSINLAKREVKSLCERTFRGLKFLGFSNLAREGAKKPRTIAKAGKHQDLS
jgi:hypothetical protein